MGNEYPWKVARPWGYELLFHLSPQLIGKVLYIKQGSRLNLQNPLIKDESMFLYSGRAMLTLHPENKPPEETIADRGFQLDLPPFTLNRLEALEDTTILEYRALHTPLEWQTLNR